MTLQQAEDAREITLFDIGQAVEESNLAGLAGGLGPVNLHRADGGLGGTPTT